MTAPASFAFPPGFRGEDISVNGTTLYVRHGGKGPAVVLLHGFGDTGDMWAPVAAATRSATTRSSFRICGASGSRRIRKTAMQEDRRRVDIRERARSASRRQSGSGYARYRQHGRLRPRGAVSRNRVTRSVVIGRAAAGDRAVGRDHAPSRCCGISTFADPTSSVWLPGASASISIVSGTSSSATSEAIDETTRRALREAIRES